MQIAKKTASGTAREKEVADHPLMAYARWAKGRDPEARAVLLKGQQVALLGQFGDECSAILMDHSVEKTVIRGGRVLKKGERYVRDFQVVPGTLGMVIPKFMTNGWVPSRTQGLLEMCVPNSLK